MLVAFWSVVVVGFDGSALRQKFVCSTAAASPPDVRQGYALPANLQIKRRRL